MKKLFFATITTFLLLPFLLLGEICAQGATFSVEVVSVGTPIIVTEPEYTVGLENMINWNEPDLAVEYYAEVSTDSTFGTVNDNSGWISERVFTFLNLDDDTKYYYRVKSKNGVGGEGAWSAAEFSTQDDNAPTSRALELPATTTTASFDIDLEYFDQTSGVDEITLFYRKDDGAWTAYSTFAPVSSITFNSLLTGSDGDYDFYAVAVDTVGNVEFEVVHVDATTVVDTTIPTPPTPPTTVPPTPTPTHTPTPTYFVFIHTISNTYVKEVDAVTLFDIRPVVKGYSSPLKKLDWTLKKDSVLVSNGYVRSGDDDYWEVELPDLSVGSFDFEISFTQDGTRYSDDIRITIVDSREVSFEGFVFPEAQVFAYFNGQEVDLGLVGDNGILQTSFQVPVGFSGDITFIATKDSYKSEYNYKYKSGTESITDILFPPIIYPQNQQVGIGQTATARGYAFPNASLKILVNDELFAETVASDDGSFEYEIFMRFELKQYSVTAMQKVDELESASSSPALIYVMRFAIPYLYKVGNLVERRFASIAQMTGFISALLVVIQLGLTVSGGIILASASTIAGFYYMLQDWLAFSLFIVKRKKRLKLQVWGVDYGNKEGILYLIDKSTNTISYKTVIDREGVGYLPRIEGHYLVRFVPTRNTSWMKMAVRRKQQVHAFYNDEFTARKRDQVANITFDSREEIFTYPFNRFEKRFDRIIGFVSIPVSVAAIVSSVLSFYFYAEYSSLFLIISSIFLLTLNILFLGYRKPLYRKIDWEML